MRIGRSNKIKVQNQHSNIRRPSTPINVKLRNSDMEEKQNQLIFLVETQTYMENFALRCVLVKRITKQLFNAD
jgi:hypothetical protein